jgi:hypothetical protein
MKLPKFLIIVLTVTIISLCLVYQQTQITVLTYLNGRNNKAYQELLDKNIALRYNLEKTRSISSLGNKVLVGDTNFEIPQQTQLAQIERPREYESFAQKAIARETILTRIFGARTEAEAKTTK